MSIYNTETWLREAVDSVIAQDIGFENVQLIFVNDGSPDNSEEICLEYQRQYPENIVCIKQKNKGLSGARNTGLKHREGKYINFFDPDDILTKNVLSEVWTFFESHNEAVNSVAIPLQYFEARTGMHPRYNLLGNQNRVVELDAEPECAVLSSASAFYKSEIFEGLSYDTKMFGSEDVKFNVQVYEQCPRFGYVCERGVTYLYRQRKTANSIVDQLAYRPESFQTVNYLLDFITKGKKTVEPFKQEVIIYELRSRLLTIKAKYFDSFGEYDNLIEAYRKYIRMVDPERISKLSPFLVGASQRYIFLSEILSKVPSGITGEGRVEFAGGGTFPLIDTTVHVKNTTFTDEGLKLDVIAHGYRTPNLSVVLKDASGAYMEPIKEEQLTSSYDAKYGDFTTSVTTYQQYLVPYDVAQYQFYFMNKLSGNDYLVERVSHHRYSPFVLNSKYIKHWYGSACVSFFENNIIVTNEPKKEYRNNLLVLSLIAKRYHQRCSIALMRLLNRTHKKYLLLNDRPNIARDNAEALFSYISRGRPDISKKTYFVIDRTSSDFKRLKQVGKVVARGGLRHKFLFLNAEYVISSHLHPVFMNPFKGNRLIYYRDLLRYKFIWLQHGITMNGVARAANKFNELPHKTIVATGHEIDEFSKPEYFYGADQIITSGMPRFDKLTSRPKKIIALMPTWRTYLAGPMMQSGNNSTKDGFKDTQYYQMYKQVLENKRLLSCLKKQGYKIHLILHPSANGYFKYFTNLENDVVKVIKTEDVDYTQIFSEASVLVTDYSSVFFDFSYLYKPVVYYQFDPERFFTDHYQKGAFDYKTMGTGPITSTHSQLIKEITELVKNGCRLQPKYKHRIDKLYLHHDKNNSKRALDAILAIDETTTLLVDQHEIRASNSAIESSNVQE